MKTFYTLIALLFISTPAIAADMSGKTATLYKNPGCSCCDGYADHLRKHGFKVEVKPPAEHDAISKKAGIPEDFQGCHTTFIDGYAIGGHVPVSAIQKLLNERPKVKGISLPGMPAGSPGMGGEKDEPWKIYSVGDGKPKVYVTE